MVKRYDGMITIENGRERPFLIFNFFKLNICVVLDNKDTEYQGTMFPRPISLDQTIFVETSSRHRRDANVYRTYIYILRIHKSLTSVIFGIVKHVSHLNIFFLLSVHRKPHRWEYEVSITWIHRNSWHVSWTSSNCSCPLKFKTE